MNTNKPLTREDVERLLQETGSSTKLVLNGGNLGGIDLSGLDLSQANLRNANLSGANLSGANLSQIKLDFANLNGADLSQANLRNANLSGADLSGADLSGADLSGTDLSQADLGKTDLSEVNPGNFVTNLFRGRINRRSYIVGTLASEMVEFLILLAANSLIHINTHLAALVILLLVLLAFVVPGLFFISLAIRRFHDIDKSGFYILWLFVPLINFYYLLVLLFERGTVGPNRYGPPPRPSIHLFSDPTQ